jgi:hypothetical protein
MATGENGRETVKAVLQGVEVGLKNGIKISAQERIKLGPDSK